MPRSSLSQASRFLAIARIAVLRITAPTYGGLKGRRGRGSTEETTQRHTVEPVRDMRAMMAGATRKTVVLLSKSGVDTAAMFPSSLFMPWLPYLSLF